MKILKPAVILLFLSGCAGPALYQRAQGANEGYSETQIQDRVYSIQFKGNESTDIQRVMDFALLRAAELAVQRGHRYFTILNEAANVHTTSTNVPQTVPQPLQCIGDQCIGGYYTTWQTIIHQTPYAYLLVESHRERPGNNLAYVFEAEQVKANVRRQYGLVSSQPDITVKSTQS